MERFGITISMRGKPEEIDEITTQLQDFGLHAKPIKPVKRYLLKKNP